MEAAASIIAFVQAASAITKGIIKAKQIWGQLKEIPDELVELIDQLQAFEGHFLLMEAYFRDIEVKFRNVPSSGWNDALAEESLKRSFEARKILEDLVTDLSLNFSDKKGFKKKIGLAKVYIKQDVLVRSRKRLKRCISILNMTMNLYQMAISKYNTHLMETIAAASLIQQTRTQVVERQAVQYQTIENRVEEPEKEVKIVTRSSLSTSVVHDHTPSKWGRFGMTYTKGTGAWQACIQWPSWIAATRFEFLSNPTASGWNYQYRVYNIISPTSEIINRVRKGDIKGVRELFDTGKASPFDKDDEGNSLLHYAADGKRYEVCRLLLDQGLEGLLDDVIGKERNSPLTAMIYEPKTLKPDPNFKLITQLFQSRLPRIDPIPISRLFDFLQEWAHDDEFVSVFQQKFMPNYYEGSVKDRLEAVRLGSFHMRSPFRLLRLLASDMSITSSDISTSAEHKLSLLHSTALAIGIRFADEVLPYKRAECQWRVYNDSWSEMAVHIVSMAHPKDLHSVEEVKPWDLYHVPSWRGTPLVSLLGGALCYLSPEISFYYWDRVFQETLKRWLKDLQDGGVDLFTYGQQELVVLKDDIRGAFDADAVERSRFEVRASMSWSAANLKVKQAYEDGWNANHWVPIRILDLKFGPSPDDWALVWAPEFEFMAFQFWNMIDRESMVMPGAWVDG